MRTGRACRAVIAELAQIFTLADYESLKSVKQN
jgi:hypothetical protein